MIVFEKSAVYLYQYKQQTTELWKNHSNRSKYILKSRFSYIRNRLYDQYWRHDVIRNFLIGILIMITHLKAIIYYLGAFSQSADFPRLKSINTFMNESTVMTVEYFYIFYPILNITCITLLNLNINGQMNTCYNMQIFCLW